MPNEAERLDALARVRTEAGLRGLSRSTPGTYVGNCSLYMGWLGDRPLAQTGEEDVRGWSPRLSGARGLAPKTVNTYLAAVMFMYGAALGRPLDRARVPFRKVPRPLPEVLSREEAGALLRCAANGRHRAPLALGYGCGLRISEACSLRVRDVDSRAGRLFVRAGKGGKDRHAVLPDATLSALRRHWAVRRPGNGGGWMFDGARGYAHISASAAEAAVRQALRAAGIDRPGLSSRALRHSFATHMLEDGAGLLTTKELLGHSAPATTCACIHLADSARGVPRPIDALGPLW